MLPRPRADDRLLGPAAVEDDHSRDREHVVTRGGLDVLVDVELHERDALLVLPLELGEDRLDGPAGTAPGSPEVDDHRPFGSENVVLEGAVGDLAHLPIVPALETAAERGKPKLRYLP